MLSHFLRRAISAVHILRDESEKGLNLYKSKEALRSFPLSSLDLLLHKVLTNSTALYFNPYPADKSFCHK